MTIEPDSPTISEWLDGRLPADEADAVAAAVRANPALGETAAELRRVKQMLLETGDQPVEPTGSLVSAVMTALAGEAPGDTDPFAHAPADASGMRPPHDETDEEVDEKVEEEWQRVEQTRLAEERAEAYEDEEAIREARRIEGPAAGSDRKWLKPAFSVALAAGLLVAVLLNIGDETATDANLGKALPTRSAAVVERPEIDPAALAERMLARGIELTAGRQSMGTLHMTVHLGDREGRRQFEELLARSRVRLDREETMPGGRVERIGCLGDAAEVDRLLETLAVSTGSVVVQAGSLSREAIDRLERRGPVAEPMIAAADAQVETATEPVPPPTAVAAAAPAADVAAAGTAAPPIAALAQGDAPRPQGRSLTPPGPGFAASRAAPAAGAGGGFGGSGGEGPPMAAAMTVKSADAPPLADEPPPPPPQLISPDGSVRLWIDIVDDTKPVAADPPTVETAP